MKIGDKVWIIDENRRVYVDKEGNRTSAPIFREKFVERYIIGETRVSWILGHRDDLDLKRGDKVKKADAQRIIYTSEKEIDERCWIRSNQYTISEEVRRCDDFAILNQIAELLKNK